MSSPLTDVLTRLDRSRIALTGAIELLPARLREQAPAEARWSAAGVLEHLALVEERYTAILAAGIAAAPVTSAVSDPPGAALLPATLEEVLADRTARRTAPEPVHPRGMEWHAALERAEAARVALRRLLAEADTRAWSRIVHEHPRFGTLNVYQWGQFLAAHESRHADQIREIAAQLADQSPT